MDWTHEEIQTLRDLWAAGHSTADIGRRMGVSKNSIVGKAHRIGIPHRPSPIGNGGRRTSEERVAEIRDDLKNDIPIDHIARRLGMDRKTIRRIKLQDGETRKPLRIMALPPLPSEMVPAPAPRQVFHPEPIPAPEPLRIDTARTCCWPIGEPGTKTFRFCADAPVMGKPYCGAHCSVAYLPIRRRAGMEEAA